MVIIFKIINLSLAQIFILMKKSFIQLAVGFIFLVSIGACDIIKDPVKDSGNGGNNPTPDKAVKRVLLEEYTGHQCQNCPEAIQSAKIMKDLYGADRVIIVAIHAGNFANINANYPTELRHPEGIQHYEFYNKVRGVPAGLINRIDYSTNNAHLKTHGSWASIAGSELEKELLAEVSIEASYNASNKNYSADIKLDALANIEGNYSLGLFAVENNIIAPQLDASTRIEEFNHNSVFKGSANGIFGQSIWTGTTVNGTQTIETLTGTLGANVVAENVCLIAFLKNVDTHEIIQVNQIKLIE